jgi:hypothetical protein
MKSTDVCTARGHSFFTTLYILLHPCMMKSRNHFVQSFTTSTCLEDVCFCMSYLVSSAFLLNSFVVSCFFMSTHVLCCIALHCLILSVLSFLFWVVLSRLVLSCLVLSRHILFYCIMPYHVTSYHIRANLSKSYDIIVSLFSSLCTRKCILWILSDFIQMHLIWFGLIRLDLI